MRIAALAIAATVALVPLAAAEGASAKSRAGYRHHHVKHHVHAKHRVHRHRKRHRVAMRGPYRGPAITLWQKRYEEPQWNPYQPFGYGTAYAPD